MARRRGGGHGGAGAHADANRWLLTYADLITLLLILFIMLFAISQVDISKYHKLADAMSNAFNVIPSQGGAADSVLPPGSKLVLPPVAPMYSEDEFKKLEAAEPGSVSVIPGQRGVHISIADSALFDPGSADLKPLSRPILDRIAAELARTTNRILVEGHTDDRPISTPRYPSNWELSTARATNVLRLLIDRYHLPPSRLAASGYGEHYPRVPNDTDEHRAMNRRVDIVILKDAGAKQQPAPPPAPDGQSGRTSDYGF